MSKYSVTVSGLAIVLIIILIFLWNAFDSLIDLSQDLLTQPAATSNLTIEELHIKTWAEDGTQLEFNLTGLSGNMQSKIIDLILLALD